MQPVINVFIGKRVRNEDSASTKQMRILMSLCQELGNDFPFSNATEAKLHLSRMTVYRSIKQLQKGYKLVFVFPDKSEEE